MSGEFIQNSNPYILCLLILGYLLMEIIKLVLNRSYQNQRLKHIKGKEKIFSNSEN